MNQVNGLIVQLGLDHSFYVLFGLLIVLNFILNKVYFNPYQHLIEERKRKTSGSKVGTKEAGEEINKKIEQYKEQMKLGHAQTKAVFAKIEQAARAEEVAILSSASAKAKTMIQEVQTALQNQKMELLASVDKDVPQMTKLIVEKVLGRSI